MKQQQPVAETISRGFERVSNSADKHQEFKDFTKDVSNHKYATVITNRVYDRLQRFGVLDHEWAYIRVR